MRIGWRKLYSYLRRKPSEFYSVGIEVDANHLHVSVFKLVNDKPFWSSYQTFPFAGWQDALKGYVTELGLANTRCAVAFSSKKYKLLQVDRPSVPDDELAQALHWSVQELMSSQDEMVVDFFDLPAQTMGANKVNVVAVNKSDLYSLCQDLIDIGLFVHSITIEDLAICDLIEPSHDATLTLVQKPGAEINLNIIKDAKLYFSRQIRGYEKLSSFTEMELQMGLAETLSVEVQRSMDYFESQLRQGGVKKLYLHLDTEHQDLMADLINKAMLIETHPLIPDVEKNEALNFNTASFVSLGAGLLLDPEQEPRNEV